MQTLGQQCALGVRKCSRKEHILRAIQPSDSRATAGDMAQHSILVGVDGSEAAKDAVRWAAGVMRDGDTLRLITVSSRCGASALCCMCRLRSAFDP